MSDPVTNVEIEDVLSSIKRLVSSGKKREEGQETARKDANEQPERFVLTQALRVGGPQNDNESATDSADEDDVWVTESQPAAKTETTLIFDASEEDQAVTEPANSRESLEATIAELEAAVTAQPDDWEPDGSEVNSRPTWATVTYPALDDVEDAVAVDDSDAAAEDADHAETPDGEDNVASIGVSFVHLPSERRDVDDADTDYGDELMPDAPLPEKATGEGGQLSEGGILDEAVLREIVTQTLREELKGQMGERITRNVRKMVRREIHRMLTSKEFD